MSSTVERELASVHTRFTQLNHTLIYVFGYNAPRVVTDNGVVMTRATSSFARLLRSQRLVAGLTQEELAERARLSARAISDLERGVKVLPHRHTVELLAGALEIPVEDLERAIERRRRPLVQGDRRALPIPPTSFVGREVEVRGVTNLLRQAGTRLVTVTGPPGIGKTRLTLATARMITHEFADGAIFVPLATIRNAALVPKALAQTLGIYPADPGSVDQQLIDHLRAKQILLVIDNFEHVLDAGTTLAQIVAPCPNVKLLVSSRAVLNIQGEHRFDLGPLDLPEPGQIPTIDDLPKFSALQLFSERARLVNPNFHFGTDNVTAIVEICRRLNGLPLAIELASARVNVLSPQDLLTRLERQLHLLTGGPRDLPERHRTMRRAISWSYELLSEPEKRLFRRLAYFSGGFSLEAAEAIANGGEDESDRVLDELTMLVDKSLVRPVPGHVGGTRFTMLEVIREFGIEQLLEHDELEMTADLHRAYFVTLVERNYPEHSGYLQTQWFRRLEPEQGNLRLAARRIAKSGNGAETSRVDPGLWRFWERSHTQEGREWLDAVLGLPKHAASH